MIYAATLTRGFREITPDITDHESLTHHIYSTANLILIHLQWIIWPASTRSRVAITGRQCVSGILMQWLKLQAICWSHSSLLFIQTGLEMLSDLKARADQAGFREITTMLTDSYCCRSHCCRVNLFNLLQASRHRSGRAAHAAQIWAKDTYWLADH